MQFDPEKLLAGIREWVLVESPTYHPGGVNRMMDLAEKALKVHERLIDFFGYPEWRNPLPAIDELVSTILSQNTNDTNRDVAFNALREKFPTWEAVRDAGAEDEAVDIRPGQLRQVRDLDALARHRFAAHRRIVPGDDARAALPERPRGREARRAEAHDCHGLSAKLREVDHRPVPYRSFSVARPMRARIEAMIQKRITMVDSAHPFFSK